MTGLAMATLRAWERRYEFPEAERTRGGHRLYSEMDVLRLQWVKERIDEGMQTAQAIQALHYQEEKQQEMPLESYQNPANTMEASGKPDYPLLNLTVGSEPAALLPTITSRLLTAILGREMQQADWILSEALAVFPPEELILQVIAPAFTAVGEAWEQKHISIATEHLATNYLRQRLLMWMLNAPPPQTSRSIVLACAPQEWHEGSLLVLGALLRRRRWPVAYLGQAVPLADLASFVKELDPALVVLTAMTAQAAEDLITWPEIMPDLARPGAIPVGFGGRAFTLDRSLRQRMPGVFLGETLRQGIDEIDRLLTGTS
jgi:DNA-binding transcriptional MerR regulator